MGGEKKKETKFRKMGIGFVLIVWAILLGVLSIPILAIAFLAIFIIRKRMGERTTARQFTKFAFVAPIVLTCCFFGFILTAVINEFARGVDPGIGDGWQVPIKNDYIFSMIDVTDHGSLMKGRSSGVPIVAGITKLDFNDGLVMGQLKDSSFFILNVSNDSLFKYSRSEFRVRASNANLSSANDFYLKKRGRLIDLIMGIIFIVIPSILIIRFWYRKSFKIQ